MAKAAREVGAQTATPTQLQPAEVPSRAARVNGETTLISPGRIPSVMMGANRLKRLLVEERIIPMINLGGTAGV